MKNNDYPIETEIKLRLTVAARKALERHPAFQPPRASLPEVRHEVTTYFDTRGLKLSAKGFTLRVRRCGQQRIQTVKADNNGTDVAFQRHEWEWPVNADTPDVQRLAELPVGQGLEQVRAVDLCPIFRTEITRTVRRLRPDDDTTIEAAIDQGRIVADGLTEPIFEAELELKVGGAASLYRLALALVTATPMSLESSSKAERGFHLHTGGPPQAVTAADVEVAGNATTAEAFHAIVGTALHHLIANVAAAAQSDSEGVHQVRVAVRRLRSALVLFEPHLHARRIRTFNSELRRIGQIFGVARDWDVFVLQTLASAATEVPHDGEIDELRAVAETYRAAAHRSVCAELGGARSTRLILAMASWIEDGVHKPTLLGDASMAEPISDIAPHLLERMLQEVVRLGHGLDDASIEELHHLRRAVKRLRYSVEFLSGLHPRHQVRNYLDLCQELQERLGAVTDTAVATAMLERLQRKRRRRFEQIIDMISKWNDLRSRQAHHHITRAWHRFHSTEPYWR